MLVTYVSLPYYKNKVKRSIFIRVKLPSITYSASNVTRENLII